MLKCSTIRGDNKKAKIKSEGEQILKESFQLVLHN